MAFAWVAVLKSDWIMINISASENSLDWKLTLSYINNTKFTNCC